MNKYSIILVYSLTILKPSNTTKEYLRTSHCDKKSFMGLISMMKGRNSIQSHWSVVYPRFLSTSGVATQLFSQIPCLVKLLEESVIESHFETTFDTTALVSNLKLS